MELRRKIYDELCLWKKNAKGRSALLIEGARRIGKSYIAEQFGKNEYRSYVLIDFSIAPKQVLEAFEQDVNDLSLLFNKLAAYYGKSLYERDTLFIFDEVQLFPKARQLVKHLVAYGKYDILETGSLITLKKNVQDILLPSEEDGIAMYPLDFEEFLWALDEGGTYEFVRDCFAKKQPVGEAVHRKLMNRFREYMLVGGMPQSVLAYAQTKSFEKSDIEKRRILRLYREDVAKFAKGYESRVLAIFDNIPGQLSKHEKKYVLATLGKDARFRDYEDAFIWLDEARVILPCFHSTDPNVGLGLNEERTVMKCYMNDIGLLVSHTFSEEQIMNETVNRAFLFDKLSFNEGMFFENCVAQMLALKGRRLFFYSESSRENADDRMEIDFLLRDDKKICPIEVKSSSYQSHKSLDKIKRKYGKKIGTRYVIYAKDLRAEEDLLYVPVYMTLCL